MEEEFPLIKGKLRAQAHPSGFMSKRHVLSPFLSTLSLLKINKLSLTPNYPHFLSSPTY